MNPQYLTAIKKFEGFTSQANWDYAQFSNGYGTRAKFAGEVIDPVEAERRFAAEIAEARAAVDKFAPGLDEGTKSALTSLTFNTGPKWMNSGLGAAVASGNLAEVRQIFVSYDKAGGQVMPGLSARRALEAAWIGNPVDQSLDPSLTQTANAQSVPAYSTRSTATFATRDASHYLDARPLPAEQATHATNADVDGLVIAAQSTDTGTAALLSLVQQAQLKWFSAHKRA